MKKRHRIYIILALLLFGTGNTYAQTQLTRKLSYSQKDYCAFMRNNRNYYGVSLFGDWQNFPNAANKHWMSSMYGIGMESSALWYPLMLEVGTRWKNFGKIDSPYQIPTFQSAKINNKYKSGSFVSLSVFPLPYWYVLKRTQEYISPYVGIGYQWESLAGWDFDSYDDYYNLNLSSWYWKTGCYIFLNDFVPFDLFVEYVQTINPDKIRNYECIRMGIIFRYSDLFNLNMSKKSFSKSLINLKK